jgi:glycine betaine/proline transport system permease protein
MTRRLALPLAFLALTLGLAAISARLPSEFLWPPQGMQLPMAGWITAAMTWLTDSAHLGPVSFKDLTRGFAALIEAPYDAVRLLLVEGITKGRGRRATVIVPPVSWLAVTVAAIALGHYARDLWLGLLAGAYGKAPWSPWPRSPSPCRWAWPGGWRLALPPGAGAGWNAHLPRFST